jgi:hypothetical protein
MPESPEGSAGRESGRVQKRIAVGLSIFVRGTDAEGRHWEEETTSGNVSRSGASFPISRKLAVGDTLEVKIPKRPGTHEPDYETPARVVRVNEAPDGESFQVGVMFLGPRFHRVFVSESSS